jgi:aryl-phospho-beta-D-glucosidase BglC (GH1 family)
MKNKLIRKVLVRLFAGVLFFSISTNAWAQLPTAQTIAGSMKLAWNLGNTLEAICGETAWGAAVTTQRLIDSVKAAGFNTIRLPCAWDCHTSNGVIDAAWIARVKQVVDYCINDNLYVILNIHWDGGWLENNVTQSAQSSVNAKQNNYWTQIANYFKSYNEHLLFASANEPNASDATGMSVLLSYHQTFVNAVRATGGNNSSRTLIVQGPNTNIGLTNTLMNTLPTDQIAGRMMVEIHYYDPPQFCILTQDASWGNMFYYWGKGYHSTTDVSRNATYGEESYLDSNFMLMKSKFVDKGIPVIIGEFASIKHNLTAPSDQQLHLASRRYFYRYLVSSAKSKGLIPIVWDIPGQMFDRSTGTVLDRDLINAMNQGSNSAYVSLVNHASGLLIDGIYRSTNGAAAGQWSNSGSDAQKWLMETVGSYVKLKNKATGLYLDGLGDHTNGDAVGQWSNSSSDNQQWSIEPAGNYIRLRNKATGQYLDGIYRYSNGSDLGQWSYSNSDAQQWTLNTTGLTTAMTQRTVRTGQSAMLTDTSSGTPDGAIRISPNPFQSTFTIVVDDPAKVGSIRISDLAGHLVEVIGQPLAATRTTAGASLKPGMYIVKVRTTSGTKTFKVVKLK